MQSSKILGDYNIVKQIGQGPLGTVFLAEHRFMKKHFAIKVLPEELASDRSFIQRFEEEVSKLSKLDHPHLVKIHNISYANGVYFLVTDCIVDEMGETTNLAQYIMSHGRRLNETELLHILKQIADALDYLHQVKSGEHCIIHGSLKFNNILVSKKNSELHVYLCDVGLTPIISAGAILSRTFKSVSEALEIGQNALFPRHSEEKYPTPPIPEEKFLPLHSSFLQTFAFLAPEQKLFNAKSIKNYKVDVYAFGILVYYLIIGKFPEGYFDLPSVLVSNLKWNWDELIKSCLRMNPENRVELLLPLIQNLTHFNPEIEKKCVQEVAAVQKIDCMTTEVLESQQEHHTHCIQGRPQISTPHPVAEAVIKQYSDSRSRVTEPQMATAQIATFYGHKDESTCTDSPSTTKESLQPVIHHARLERPVNDLDPSAVFNIESTVTQYVPEKKEVKDVEPILTNMAVIKGGNFLRGSSSGNRDSIPAHQIYLDSFALDLHPVTNEQFVRFLEALGGEKDSNHKDVIRLKESRIKRSAGKISIESGYAKHPVVGVTWYGAAAYAKWVGKRLPTEAEWEIASKGGNENSKYPTGDDIEKNQANFFSSDTTSVMSYSPNSYGLYDMAGNVYEWCQDWYGYNYYEMSVQEPDNPQGPLQGVYRVLRGGCWKSLKDDLLCSRRHRNNPATVNSTYGFRCAADVQ